MKNNMGVLDILKTIFRFGRVVDNAQRGRIWLTVVVYIALPLSDLIFNVYLLHYIVRNYDAFFSLERFTMIMLVLLLVQILIWAIESYYTQYYADDSIQRICDYFLGKIYKNIEVVSSEEFDNPDFYDKYYFVLNNLKARIRSFFGIIEAVVASAMMIITLSTIIFVTDPMLILFVLFPLFVECVVSPHINKLQVSKRKEDSNIDRHADYIQRVFYLKDYAKEIRTTHVKNILFSQFERIVCDYNSTIKKFGKSIGIRNFLIEYSFQVFSFFCVVLYLVIKTFNNEVSPENAIVIISTYNQIVYSLKSMVDTYFGCLEQCVYFKEILDFTVFEHVSSIQTYSSIPDTIESIEFKNVSYRYKNSKDLALKNVSFKVVRGQKVVILGYNGAGKSTLMKLISLTYKPTEGDIFINGINVNQFDEKELRKKISVLRQNFVVFATDLEKNILLKSIETDEDKAAFNCAIKKSGFLNKYVTLERGSKTIISKEFNDTGIVLSGGEMQKVAIARVLANDADVQLFDEPTSAMDPISEESFFGAIFDVAKYNMTFIVSHNFSFAKKADYILFFSEGELIEKGTHNYLISSNKEYSRLFKLQAKYFE